jgi:hypothetical protein
VVKFEFEDADAAGAFAADVLDAGRRGHDVKIAPRRGDG